ncbi:TolC family protein [Psychroserpens damuponensis]|uniref:TolC family protein n=1 Tax=Psychroserpens damuponensis TaxID=943936 RepID=UPI00058DACD2|nr:TolC family protein [Psychroserpens damuponensis]
MRYLQLIVFLLTSTIFAQTKNSITLSFSEYLGYVKKYHPIAKQAELTLQIGQAHLMKARGAFDPKIEIDNTRKTFKNIEYYDQLNATFKIPTWYGIELKANFEDNDGTYLNPELNVPENGLYSAGISASLGQGLFINQRMADLKKAKLFKEQSVADRDILINQILYKASLSYFNWLKSYNETKIYEQFLENSKIRFQGIKRRVENGDKAPIDSIEASITIKNRKLGLEQAKVKLTKAVLELSTFLWLNNNLPIELQSHVIPDAFIDDTIDDVLEISGVSLGNFSLENHPKLQSLNYKSLSLEVDKKLKANKLLPQIDVQYNFLTQDPDLARSFNTSQYKGGFKIAFPIFLRKERADLKLSKFKLQDTRFEISSAKITIQNKILALNKELESFKTQNILIENIVTDYTKMLHAEERKLSFGESSLFLINSREKSLIDSKLKAIEIQNKYLVAKAQLFNSLSQDLKKL